MSTTCRATTTLLITTMDLDLGFKSVTMDDIANAMGISKKTIYAHFKNKTELVKASTFHLFDVVCDGIDIICSEEKNPIEELYQIKAFPTLVWLDHNGRVLERSEGAAYHTELMRLAENALLNSGQ